MSPNYCLFFFLFLLGENYINSDPTQSSTKNFQPYKECPIDKPIQKPLTGECVMEYCTEEQYKNLECNITNPIIKTQFLNEFLYETENSLPIYSSFGTNDLGEAFFESSVGTPFSKKKIFTLKSDGREYIDGILRNIIDSGNNMYSKFGTGAIVTINEHKCYMKFSNESLEFYDFIKKKYTFANLKEKLGGYEIQSEKNTLIRTNVANTFIFAFITSGNYLMMIKFKVVTNDANDCIQIIKTLKEDFKSIPTNTRSCMITKNQYIECLDIKENQVYVIRIYNTNLQFMKEYELEKNNAPLEKAIYMYHEAVFLKDEISIFSYFNDVSENNAKPIVVLKKLTVRSNVATLSNLNSYLTRDIFFKNMKYQFSDTENSLAIFNSYYFGITSLAFDTESGTNQQHLILALANIFNDDKTIDNHYFDIPLILYDINYLSGLRSFGYKNAYGFQINYLHNNIPTSGFIVLGYANTTDPQSINNLFDKYDSYTIKIKDFYKGIQNNLFCYVFLHIVVTQIPSSTYFSVKTSSYKTVKVGSTLSLDEEITITKVKGKTPPSGTYVLGLAPYLNEADYQGFTDCSVDRDMFGEQIPTNWYPDEFYGRTIEFKFTVGIDCHDNCLTCKEKGNDLNDQKCTSCKDGYYFMDNTNNCFGEIPEGYYFDETKKTFMECYKSCKVCSKNKDGNNHNCLVCKDNYFLYNNSNCFNCKEENKYLNYEQTGCINEVPDGYFINDTTHNTIDKCFEKCKTCNEASTNEENMKCLTCDNEKGFYLKDGTNNCINEIKEGEYLDNKDKTIKKCNIACKACSSKEVLNSEGDIINCDSCNVNEGFYLINGTTICTNKTIENTVEEIKETESEIESETGIESEIESESETESITETETKEVKKCHENCLTCFDSPLSDQEMNCLTCDNDKGYYMLEGTNNCIYFHQPIYSKTEPELKFCYKDCLTCTEGPITNEEGIIINMNCDSCDESKGLFLINGTKNCALKEEINPDVCPRDKPILKNGKCVKDYCSKEQYESGECVVSNPIIKTQWIDNLVILYESDQPIYSTMAKSNNDLIFETNIGTPNSTRNIYILDENARGYYDGIPDKVIDLKSDFFSTHGNGALMEVNGNKVFMKLSYFETIELYDFKEDKYTFALLEEKLGYKVESSKNSLLETNEENTFIYAYITIGNHLIMTKFKIVSNDAENCMKIIKTSLEDFVTIPKTSRRCILTPNEFVECLDIDENKNYLIRIYDTDLNFLKQYELGKINTSLERSYDLYHEAIWLKNNISVFAYYNGITDNYPKLIVSLQKLEVLDENSAGLRNLEEKDDLIESINLILIDEMKKLADYYISEIENSLAKINENLFALASLTTDENKHLLLTLMDLFNNDSSIDIKHYDIPLKDLYDIDYYGNLKLFGFKNIFGVQFDYRSDNLYKSAFIIFGFGNNIGPDFIENMFEKNDTYNLNPSEYINIQNNVFCYKLENIVINGIPDESSGVIVQRNNEEKTVLKNGDLLDINEKIIITYNKSLIDKSNSDFSISFTPNLKTDDSIKCFIDEEIVGENKTKPKDSEVIKGKTFYFQFTVDNCYKNCLTCREAGKSIVDQKCKSCLDNYYFVEGTNNCYEKDHPPIGYYFDEKEKKFKKCYENCKTCVEKGTSEYDMKCTSCDNYEGYYFFSGTKNCKKMPIPGYYISKEDNKIKKCDIACATCSYEPIRNENNEVINCDTCNKDYGFYNVEGSTICRNKTKIGEYYDESCKCYKKCYKDCLTCSGEAIDQYNMNCLSCDSSKGYQFFQSSSNCLNCKYLNKIVNYDQTECIDKVPEGYYLNDTEKNTIDLCHQNCIKCSRPPSKEGNSETQNCITCQHGLYLKNGNCIKTYTCPYNFFYQGKIDKYADINQKICLDKDEICPCALPFIVTSTNECVETCPLDLILNEGCKISNAPYGLNKMVNLIELSFQQGLTNSISKSFALSDIDNLKEVLIKITLEKIKNSLKLVRRRLQSFGNYKKKNITDDFESSDINLGECEFKLREYYKIPDDISLNLIKLEIKTNNSLINHVQYEVFNPYNKSEKLDLSICQEEKVKLINRIDVSLIQKKLSNIIETYLSEEANIFSENSKFYKDYCSNYISGEGADILIQDRIKDYYYKGEFCQSGCELNDINITSGLVTCLCPPNSGLGNISILNIDEIYLNALVNENNDFVLNIIENDENKKYSSNNFKALKCIKNIFSSKYSKNYILIILSILIILYLVVMIIFIIYKKNAPSPKISNPPHPNDKKEKTISKKDGALKNKVIESYGKFIDSGEKLKKKSKKHRKEVNNTSQEGKTESEYSDIKSFYHEFKSLLKKRKLIISCFYNIKNEKEIFILKILLMIFLIINFIGINTFFFSEKNIHQIYLDKNEYNFCYQFKYIILSAFISYILIRISKYLSEVDCKDKNRFKNIIIFTVSGLISLIYWIYVGAITSLYINIKRHLLVNIIICLLFENCLEVLLILIIATLKYLALKNENKIFEKLAEIINYI